MERGPISVRYGFSSLGEQLHKCENRGSKEQLHNNVILEKVSNDSRILCVLSQDLIYIYQLSAKHLDVFEVTDW